MKRRISIILILTFMLGILTACETSTNSYNNDNPVPSAENEVLSGEDSVVNKKNHETEDNTNEISTSTPERVETKLSDSCDAVLAFGKDNEGNEYELVANFEEDYTGLKISIGVIKNNAFSLPLSETSPLLNSAHVNEWTLKNKCGYIGNGCFNYDNNIINGNNGKFFCGDDYTYLPIIDVSPRSPRKTPAPYGSPFANEDGNVLLVKGNLNQDWESSEYQILNTDDMSITELPSSCLEQVNNIINIEGDIVNYWPLSENWFCIATEASFLYYCVFFNIETNEALSLLEYNVQKSPEPRMIFENGKCSFVIENNNGTYYEICIDTKGNVLSSQKYK